jgi:hypothetical protein
MATPDVPEKNPQKHSGGEPLEEAERAFEEHEAELLERFLAKAERRIPAHATVAEAMAEIQRAIFEDSETRELGFRISMLAMGGGTYLQSKMGPAAGAEPRNTETRYELADRPDRDLMRAEIKLLKRLSDEVNDRLPEKISEPERRSLTQEMLSSDPGLAALLEQLRELGESREGTPLWEGLAQLSEEEAEEEAEQDI